MRFCVATAGAHTFVDDVLSCPSTLPILARFPAILVTDVLFDCLPSTVDRVQVPKILAHQLRRQLGPRGEKGGYYDWIRGEGDGTELSTTRAPGGLVCNSPKLICERLILNYFE